MRVDFPAGAGRIFSYIFFPILAAPILFLFVQTLRSPPDRPSRSVGLTVFAVLLATIAAGFFLTLRILARRPTGLEVRESSLVLFFGSRVEMIDWPIVL